MTCRSMLAICIIPAIAAADGSTRTQGVWLCGRYLDYRDKHETTGKCVTSQEPFSGNAFTFATDPIFDNRQSNPAALPMGSSFSVDCQANDHDGRYKICTIKNIDKPENRVCGASDRLLVINGTAIKGAVIFESGLVTPACSVVTQDEKRNQDDEETGAIGKCIDWFGHGPTKTDTDVFNACLRMVRADYCGDGKSGTMSGIWIQSYKANETPKCDLKAACFESAWGPDGGSISRLRLVELAERYQAVRRVSIFEVCSTRFGSKASSAKAGPTLEGVAVGKGPRAESVKVDLKTVGKLAKQPVLKARSRVNAIYRAGTILEVDSCPLTQSIDCSSP